MQPSLEELKFLFQPVAPVAGGVGWSEALVRWQLPDGTVRGPLDVLPHWLSPARIEAFTHFTLLRGAQVLGAHPNARVSVNLSPIQLLLPATLRALESMLPSVTARLHIEVTEECYSDAPALARHLQLLRERCGIVLLDDVTPADLHSRLRFEAPVDGIKVDRSVVNAALYAEGASWEAARGFIRAAAERFEIVVAEGVEDPSVSEDLQALGVSHVQGFGIAKPGAELRTVDGAVAAERYGAIPAGAGASAGAGAISSVRGGNALDGHDRRTRPFR